MVRKSAGETKRGDETMVYYIVASYLIGSIPFAYICTQFATGLDIRQVDSKNVGTTNVMRNIGLLPGLLTMIGDVVKGAAAVSVGSLSPLTGLRYVMPAFAIAGHNWPVWLRFRGGGGLATFIGSSLMLSGLDKTALAVAIWGLLFLLLRDHDRSAIAACILAPVVLFVVTRSTQVALFNFTSSFVIALRRVQSTFERHSEGGAC